MNYLYRLGRLWTMLLLACVALALLALVALLLVTRLDPGRMPRVVNVQPVPGADDVPVSRPLVLRFNEPMNRRSVERALKLTPPAALKWQWEADGRTAILSPTAPLEAGITYTLLLDTSAKSRLLRAMETPLRSEFRTAPAPVAQFIWPPDGGRMPADGAIAIRFSKPIMDAEQPQAPQPLDLQLDPPTDLRTQWVDESTVLVRPQSQLRLGQHYTATIRSLVDLAGTPLSQPFSWRFLAEPPPLVTTSPHPNAAVPADHPLVLSFERPVDPAQVSAGLTLTPSVGLLPTAQISPTTVVTLTTSEPFSAGLRYTATLSLGASKPYRWSFLVRDTPQVLASVPGAGQSISPDDDIRLLFSVEPDEQLVLSSLALTPPLPSLSTAFEGRELRISAPFQPATAYTLTLQTERRSDRFTLHFRTLGNVPALTFDEPQEPLTLWPKGSRPELQLRWSRVPQPALEVFALSRPLILQALADPELQLDPRRFGLEPLRTWSATAEQGREQIRLADADGRTLPPGAYLVRATSGQLQAQRLVIISRYELSLTNHDREVVVWAVDRSSGSPASELPLLVLSRDVPLAVAQTDGSGLWSATLNAPTGRLVVFGGDERDPAVAIGELAAAPSPPPEALLMTDLPRYAAGSTIHLSGVGLPVSTTVDLRLKGTFEVWSGATNAAGVLSTTLQLPADLAAGRYTLQAGNRTEVWAETEVVVAPSKHAEPQLTLRVSDTQVIAGVPLTAALSVDSGELPLIDTPIQWQLTRVQTDSVDLPPVIAGTVRSDATGSALLVFTTPELATPQHFVLQASLPGRVNAAVPLVIAPALQVSLSAAKQLVPPHTQTELSVRVARPDGAPAGRVTVQVAVELATWPGGRERVAQLRPLRAVTNAEGIATIDWTPPSSGRYRLIASAGPGRAETTVWAVAPGFRSWPDAPGQDVPLVADQLSYDPGAEAQFLPLTSGDPLSALLILNGPDGVVSHAAQLDPGVPIRISLPQRGPVDAEILLLERQRGRAEPRLRRGALTLPIRTPDDAAHLSLAVHPRFPKPGDLATFVLSLADGEGQPISGTAALALHEALVPVAPVSASIAVDFKHWEQLISIGPSGSVSLTVQLPEQPTIWELRAIAQSVDPLRRRVASASLQFTANEPIAQRLVLPSILRIGDEVTGTVVLRSHEAISATVVLPSVAGIETASPLPTAHILPGGGQAQSTFALRAIEEQQVDVRLLVEQDRRIYAASRPISVEAQLHPSGLGASGVLVPGAAEELTLPAIADREGRLMVAVAPDWRELLERDWERLRSRPRDDLIAAVSAVLGPAAPDDGARAVARLLALQNGDGGWGWWRGAPSHPYATDLAIRALVLRAEEHGPLVRPALDRAAILLRARLARADDGDAAALLHSALAELGESDLGEMRQLLRDEQQLSMASRALLALALKRMGSLNEGRVHLGRLLSIVPRSPSETQAVQGTALSSAARDQSLVLLALSDLEPTNSFIPDQIRSLLSLRAGDGWGTPYETVLALLALRATPSWALPETAPFQYTIELNGQLLGEGSDSRVFAVSVDRLRGAGRLSLTARQGLLAYAWWFELDRAVPGGQPLVVREYLDPLTELPLADRSLQRGAEVLVRLTVITRKPLALVELREPLPPGALVLGRAEGFHAQPLLTPGQALFAAADLPVGVHQVTFQYQLTMPGSFKIPASQLSAIGDVSAFGSPTLLTVEP